MPIEDFYPDTYSHPEESDDTLLNAMETLEEIRQQEDVRNYIMSNYNLRQIAINSKLL